MKTLEEAIYNFISENESDIRLDLGAAGFDYVKQAFKTGVELAKKFIPIEEELPSTGEDVIGQHILSDGTKTGYFICHRINDKVWCNDRGVVVQVTHWRPINFE